VAGLQRFRMGAFVIAARTGTPVVPVVIGGTRAKLRGGTWLPRPGGVTVTVCPPEQPEGADRSSWAAAVDLRDRARRAMLERLAEPDLS
jgi:1-acyl-sn-glycerol-3-phosphate acyltransferase